MSTLAARFDSECAGCGDPIAKGDQIHWRPGEPARCVACGPPAPDERRGAKTADEDAPGYVVALQRTLDELARQLDRANRRLDALEAWACGISDDLNQPPPKPVEGS